jgi:hypothetical protein
MNAQAKINEKKQSLKLIMSISSVHNIPSQSTFRKQTLRTYRGLKIKSLQPLKHTLMLAKLDKKNDTCTMKSFHTRSK